MFVRLLVQCNIQLINSNFDDKNSNWVLDSAVSLLFYIFAFQIYSQYFKNSFENTSLFVSSGSLHFNSIITQQNNDEFPCMWTTTLQGAMCLPHC